MRLHQFITLLKDKAIEQEWTYQQVFDATLAAAVNVLNLTAEQEAWFTPRFETVKRKALLWIKKRDDDAMKQKIIAVLTPDMRAFLKAMAPIQLAEWINPSGSAVISHRQVSQTPIRSRPEEPEYP